MNVVLCGASGNAGSRILKELTTYLAPGIFFEPGERTGKFRPGQNELISNSKGESRISMETMQFALADEPERRPIENSASPSVTN